MSTERMRVKTLLVAILVAASSASAPLSVLGQKTSPVASSRQQTVGAKPASDKTAASDPAPSSKPASDSTPLTDCERAELLQIIRNLQERVTRLESQVSGAAPATAPDAKPPQATAVASGAPADSTGKVSEPVSSPDEVAKDSKQTEERKDWGTCMPISGRIGNE